LLPATSIAKEDKNFIKTSSGSIKGYYKNRVVNYDDIPYAMPPVGLLRWKAPRDLNAEKSNNCN
jgi:carboxylesterase type B